jgi:hypothetical protein
MPAAALKQAVTVASSRMPGNHEVSEEGSRLSL